MPDHRVVRGGLKQAANRAAVERILARKNAPTFSSLLVHTSRRILLQCSCHSALEPKTSTRPFPAEIRETLVETFRFAFGSVFFMA